MNQAARPRPWTRFRPFVVAIMVGLLISGRVFDLTGRLGEVLTGVYVALIVIALVSYAYDWRTGRSG